MKKKQKKSKTLHWRARNISPVSVCGRGWFSGFMQVLFAKTKKKVTCKQCLNWLNRH